MSTLLNELPDNTEKEKNINLSFDEKNIFNDLEKKQEKQNVKLDQSTINQIINGIQNAADSTKLPSKDISQTTEHLTHDPNVIPDYIEPETSLNSTNKCYIDENINKDEILNIYNSKKNFKNNIDNIYDEINGPLLIAILYFIFQLPFFKKFILKYIPLLFNDDYNYNFYGYIFVSSFFSMIFYCITYGLKQFDKF